MAPRRMCSCITIVLAATLILASGSAEAGRHHRPKPKATITRWFNLLTYAAGSNLTHKAEVVAYAVGKCKQYYTRASVGVDLGYGSALYNAVNQSTVMTVLDFANYSNINSLNDCVDLNNPPGEHTNADLIKSADFALNLSAASYAPAHGGCGHFPGCTTGIIQVLAYKQPPTSTAPPSIAAAVEAVRQATLGLPCWEVSGPDASPLPPFVKYTYITYQQFHDVYQLRAYWAKLQGAPGPPLPEYAALQAFYSARAAVQWTPLFSFVGTA